MVYNQDMRLFLLIIFGLYVVASINVFAQDERYFRRLYSGDLIKDRHAKKKDVFKVKVQSPIYQLDLNNDGKMEGLVVEKAGGDNWLHIHNHNNWRLKSLPLDAKGWDSRIYRISARYISPKTRVLILHFYEGKNHYLEFDGTARLYFVTIDNGDLKTLKISKGPFFWHEYSNGVRHYHQREYKLALYDFNNDGIKEIYVKFNNNTWVYMYTDWGTWSAI